MENQEGAFEQLIIKSEQDAFAALERALKHELGDQQLMIKFDNWPVMEIRLEGPGYDSTITPDMAAGLVELQSAINRAYARTVHHSGNARKLTLAERESLQFKAKVEKGSSLIKVDLGEFAEKIAFEMVGKMGAEHLVLMVTGLAITCGSLFAYKAFLRHRTEEKRIAEEASRAIALTQEETRRMEIFGKALAAVPHLQVAKQDFDDARREIVRGTADAKSLTVNSVTLDRESARIVASTKRSASREIQLNGDYIILETHWKKDGEAKLKLRSMDTAEEFMASFQDNSLNQEQRDELQRAEWGRTKVYMSINATELRDVITTATIVSVKVQPTASP